MKKIFLMLMVLPLIGWAQSACGYGTNVDYSDICSKYRNNFSSNEYANIALNKILSVNGLAKRFALVQCDEIENCYADIIGGIRFIVYDGEFMKDVAANDHAKISIFAHEVGHHVNNHVLDGGGSLSEQRQMELEADEWSGRTMYQLGFSLEEAQEAMNSYGFDGDDTYETHPSRDKRLAAIEKGWLSAKSLVERLTSNNHHNDFSSNDDDEYVPQSQRIDNDNLENNEDDNWDNFFKLGYDFHEEDSDLALIYYSKAINAGYPHPYAYYNRGLIFRDRDEHRKAIEEFEEAINIDPNYSKAYLERGNEYWDLDYVELAIADYKRAIELDPNYGMAYNNLGIIKQTNGLEGFCADYEKACMLNYGKSCEYFKEDCENKSNILSGEDYFYLAFNEEDNELAIENYTKAINASYEYIEYAYHNRALRYKKLKKFALAIDDYSQAIKLGYTDDNGAAYASRGFCYGQLDLHHNAIADYTEAIRINPDHEIAYKNRGIAKENAGLNGFCNDWKKACQLSEDPSSQTACQWYDNQCME